MAVWRRRSIPVHVPPVTITNSHDLDSYWRGVEDASLAKLCEPPRWADRTIYETGFNYLREISHG